HAARGVARRRGRRRQRARLHVAQGSRARAGRGSPCVRGDVCRGEPRTPGRRSGRRSRESRAVARDAPERRLPGGGGARRRVAPSGGGARQAVPLGRGGVRADRPLASVQLRRRGERGMSSPSPALQQQVTLVELVDRVLNKGVALTGDITLSVAGVDLVYVGLGLRVLPATREEPSPAASGSEYMRRRLDEVARAEELGRTLHGSLVGASRESSCNVLGRRDVVLTGAYLVARDNLDRFHAAL